MAAVYAWGMPGPDGIAPGERILQKGDQVFYVAHDVEFDRKTRSIIKLDKKVIRGAGIVRYPPSVPGGMCDVFDEGLGRSVYCNECDLEYVPTYNEELPGASVALAQES